MQNYRDQITQNMLEKPELYKVMYGGRQVIDLHLMMLFSVYQPRSLYTIGRYWLGFSPVIIPDGVQHICFRRKVQLSEQIEFSQIQTRSSDLTLAKNVFQNIVDKNPDLPFEPVDLAYDSPKLKFPEDAEAVLAFWNDVILQFNALIKGKGIIKIFEQPTQPCSAEESIRMIMEMIAKKKSYTFGLFGSSSTIHVQQTTRQTPSTEKRVYESAFTFLQRAHFSDEEANAKLRELHDMIWQNKNKFGWMYYTLGLGFLHNRQQDSVEFRQAILDALAQKEVGYQICDAKKG